ncbi:MAG: hypothetical protein HDS71_07565 [Bacteroidales bacterium]|nr:hypothetical protein [Bacteroidales bacterium]
MNITEVSVTDCVLIFPTPSVKEVAIVKGFTPKGTILVKDSSGQIITVTPEQIIKKF